MKGGLAIILDVMARMSRLKHHASVTALLVADEEHGSLGMRTVRPSIQADAVVVLEGTELHLGVRHDGRIRMIFSFISPRACEEFIIRLGLMIIGVDDLRETRVATSQTEPWRVVLERKVHGGENAYRISAALDDVLRRIGARPDWCDIRPSFAESEGSVTRALIHSAATRRGVQCTPVAINGWTEAAFFSSQGVSTVVFGPGGGGAHTNEEWVDLTHVALGADILHDAVLGSSAAFRAR
jgi:acetylornithine deacetylase